MTGFISPTYNNMWCLRCYPNGKTIKNDFLIQLQLCGLPQQSNKLTTTWTITCPEVNISAGWTTDFDYTQSCWGWGNNQLSFDRFKKCGDFTITVEIKCDDKENIIALSEWQKYVNKKTKSLQISDIKQFAVRNKHKTMNNDSNLKDDEKNDKMVQMIQTSIPSPPGSPQKKHIDSNVNEDEIEWIEKRMKIQDDTMEELRNELDEIKNEVDRLIQSDNKQTRYHDGNTSDDLKNEILNIQKQVAILSKMNGKNGTYSPFGGDNKKELTEKEKVENWLNETVKLPQYYQLFIDEETDQILGGFTRNTHKATQIICC